MGEVLIVSRGIPSERDPIGLFEFDQARALAAYGMDVTYFALDVRSMRRLRRLGFDSGIRDGVRWHSLALPGCYHQGICEHIPNAHEADGAALGWALKQLYRRVYGETEKPDVIHAHFTRWGYGAAALAKQIQVPLVITEHFSFMNQDTIPPRFLRYATRTYQAADCLIAVSKPFADKLYAHTGCRAEVVHNIVDTGVFSAVKRKRRENEENSFGFIAVGNLIEIKRHALLLEAFSGVRRQYPGAFLGIVGSGELRQSLKEQAERLGLRNCVRFYGQQTREQIAHIFSESDCFVLPSRLETFGVVCAEAMAVGLPVIATRCGGPEDFVTDSTGMLVPVEDANALQDAMLDMITRADHYDAQSIRAYALEHFSLRVSAEQLCNIYRKIIC